MLASTVREHKRRAAMQGEEQERRAFVGGEGHSLGTRGTREGDQGEDTSIKSYRPGNAAPRHRQGGREWLGGPAGSERQGGWGVLEKVVGDLSTGSGGPAGGKAGVEHTKTRKKKGKVTP